VAFGCLSVGYQVALMWLWVALPARRHSTFDVALVAYNALNLDGGGSTALVIEGPDGSPAVLNRPFGPPPGLARRVASHLGGVCATIGELQDREPLKGDAPTLRSATENALRRKGGARCVRPGLRRYTLPIFLRAS